MADTDFDTLLSVDAGKDEPPKAKPGGTYRAVVKKWDTGNSSRKGTPFVEFEMELLEASGDVDQDALEEAGGVSPDDAISDQFYLTKKARFRLADFLKKLGLDVDGRQYRELLPESVGQEIMVSLETQISQRGNPYNVISDYAPVE